MKKSILSILMIVFLSITCGVFSACKDRYDNMKFKIEYAYSENATNWYDGTDGISIFHSNKESETEDRLVFESGVAKLYFRISIENVKAKYIDDIIVSSSQSSFGFNSITVKQNQIFPINIYENSTIQTVLGIYETNSRNSTDVRLNVSKALTEIHANLDKCPAVMVGGNLALLTLNNLEYLPQGTLEKGVDYSIDSLGYYTLDGRYMPNILDPEKINQYVSISNGGILSVKSNFTNLNTSNYVVSIKATSKYHNEEDDEIATFFDVYIVDRAIKTGAEGSIYKPTIKINDVIVDTFDLYTNETNNSKYARETLNVDTNSYSSAYNRGLYTHKGIVKYGMAVYVDDEKYDFSRQEPLNGLLITPKDATNGGMDFEILTTKFSQTENKVRFALEIEGLYFSSSSMPNHSTEIVIGRRMLAEGITINNETFTGNNNETSGTIYSTSVGNYKGLELELGVDPDDAVSDYEIFIDANENIIFSSNVENISGNTYKVKSGEKIVIRLKEGIKTNQQIQFRVLTTPSTLDPVDQRYFTLKYNIISSVTADKIEIFDREDGEIQNNKIIYINAESQTNILAKVFYTGTLNRSSIKLSSDNEEVKFANNSNIISLNDPSVNLIKSDIDGASRYDIYSIGVRANGIETIANIDFIVADGAVRIPDAKVRLSSVYVTTGDSIVVKTDNRDVTKFDVDKFTLKYAVVKGKSIDFEVLGKLNDTLSDLVIKDITIITDTGHNSNGFDLYAVRATKISKNIFNIMGIKGSVTQVLNLRITFYTFVGNTVVESEKVVTIEIAVYDPITNIDLNTDSRDVVYINSKYLDAASTEINFSAFASNNATPTSEVVFTGVEQAEYKNATQIQLKLSETNDTNAVSVYLKTEDREIPLDEFGNGVLNVDDVNLLRGSIIVRLNYNVHTFRNITLTFIALRFGEVSVYSNSISINVVDYESMDSIRVSGDAITSYGDDSHYIYMSFIDVPDSDRYDVVKFNANPYYASNNANKHYDELDYELYQILQDEDGSILTNDGVAIETDIDKSRLDISFANNEVIIRADKNDGGGLFRLVLVAKDSYNDDKHTYATTFSLILSISDGSEKNKYIINNEDDLYNIVNNLGANYQLRSDIAIDNFRPIGLKNDNTVQAFTGKLHGTAENLDSNNQVISTSKYKLTLNINSTITDGNGDVYSGLFAILGEGAEIRGLDLDIKFDTSAFKLTSNNNLNIGAVAGVNNGTIVGVNVSILNSSNILFQQANTECTINFGGVVGINNGKLDLSLSNINFNSDITSSSTTYHNIGLVVGINYNEVVGGFSGKDGLNSPSYTIIANTTFNYINTNTPNGNINLAAVIGKSAARSKVSNILVGGRLELKNKCNLSSSEKSNLAGIVGFLEGNVETCYAIGLDLTSNRDFNVAGIVALASSANIIDVRYISAEFSGSITALGRITGSDLVAGIVAKASGVTITRATVESFISKTRDEKNNIVTFYTLNGGNTTAGLVANASSTEISLSFVNANIQTNGRVILTSKVTEEDTYYVGRLNNLEADISSNATYAIFYNDEKIYAMSSNTIENITPDEENANKINDFISGLILNSNWSNSSNYNAILFNSQEYSLPYLIYDNDILMIKKPTSITVGVNSEYINKINSIIVGDMDIIVNESKITDTVIINYHNDPANPLNNISHNTYNLLDIISLRVVPTDAQGGVNFMVIEGSQYAYITDVNGVKKLVFTGVTLGNNRIVIRCYSSFNEDLEEFIVLYTEYGVSELIIESSNVNRINDEDAIFELMTFTGANPITFNIGANNVYDGISFNTILDANIDEYLSIRLETATNSILDIKDTTNSKTEFTLKVKDNAIFTDNREVETITAVLELNAKEYFGDNYQGSSDIIDIAQTTLRVVAMKSANEVVVVGSEPSVPTNANITFDAELYTGYMSTDTANKPFVKYSIVGDKVVLLEDGKDSIELSITCREESETELNKLLSRAKVSNIVELFDFSFGYTLLKNNLGYNYNINMSLKDEHNYRFIENNIDLIVRVSAKSNNDKYATFNVQLKPTPLSTIRMDNYTATSMSAAGSYINIISANSTETAIISPGGYGGVLMIYLEHSYSNLVSAALTSSELFVPDLNKNVRIRFEQVVYNEKNNNYETIYPRNQEIDGGIMLEKASVKGENGYEYTGVIYVHTILEKFSGLEGSITISLDVETNNGIVKSITKPLLTQYIPGAGLTYDGIEVGDLSDDTREYIVQKGTTGNVVKLKVYGYQFSAKPIINFVWNDKEETAKILDYVSYHLGDIVSNADGSYYIDVYLNVAKNIPKTFTMSANMTLITEDGQITSEDSNTLVFHPVDYVVKNNSATIKGLDNGLFSIAEGHSRYLEFIFDTDANADLSDELYYILLRSIMGEITDSEDHVKINENNLNKFLELFYYIDANGTRKTLADSQEEFIVRFINNKLRIDATRAIQLDINFDVHYNYEIGEDGKYELKFASASDNQYPYTMDFSFRLNIYPSTTEEHATQIKTAEDFLAMNANEDYILANDIVLENFTPITTNISSLDGNNRVITIKSFAVDVDRTNYGLFDTIGKYTTEEGEEKQTILKNVIVDYGQFEGLILTNNNITNITFGGLVAHNNSGLIYNSDVMAFAPSEKIVNLLPDSSNEVNIVFGGLVGKNTGDAIITNSRVGNLSYKRITASETQDSVNDYGYITMDNSDKTILRPQPISFVIGNMTGATTGQGFIAEAGAFVGQNEAVIASAYVANTSLINYSTAPGVSKTAGFAADNSGKISYSYVKALERNITSENPYSTGAKIESTTNGTVAGFVHTNSGDIDNSYANTEIRSDSTFMAGFVYNHASGTIKESYAACTFNGKHIGENTTAEQPFVGYENNELLSHGRLINTYFLIDQNVIIDKSKIPYPDNQDQADALNWENFSNADKLNNFVFVLSDSRQERSQGIWSYYNSDDRLTILPELTSTNKVTYSYRYFTGFNDEGLNNFANSAHFSQGSEFNPYIIRNVAEYNDVLTHNSSISSISGYFRLINNIDFDDNNKAITTRVGFTFGDKSNRNVTSLDGNGMTISGIFLDVGQDVEESIGLFSEIEYAYIKNLNLEFADAKFSSANVQYSGGLSGKINNSVIMNVNLNGANTVINGNNFAGGLAGIITGKGLIYSVTSNVNALANTENTSNMYYRSNDYVMKNGWNYDEYLKHLSYAGGIAGVIDLDVRGRDEYNLSYITIDGNGMMTPVEGDGNIKADFAGSIAGYAGLNTKSLKLKYNVGVNNRIRGWHAVGGLFGVNMGSITASQVTAIEETQFNYDKAYGEYVIKLSKGEESVLEGDYGNRTLLESYQYAGGLVGIGINNTIKSCYSKASFKSGVTIGGLIGISIASTVNYSYAVPFIHLDANTRRVGGLFGQTFDTIDRDGQASEYISILNNMVIHNTSHSLNSLFSTVLLDDASFESNSDFVIDYICADFGQGTTGTSLNGLMSYIYSGEVNYTDVNTVRNQLENKISHAQLSELLNRTDDVAISKQEVLFKEIFSSWDEEFWSFDDSKFYPLLLSKKADNYTLIENSSDFDKLISNPSGAFKIVNDINLFDWIETHNDSNFIFNIDFTGILIGGKEDGTTPTISGLHKRTITTGNAGLFRTTNRATIRNINFEWQAESKNPAITVNHEIAYVGGVSASDTNSLFASLNVIVATDNSAQDGNQNAFLRTNGNNSIAGFGGIVGFATNSNVQGCIFAGQIDAQLKGIGYTNNIVNFGGLVGYSMRQDDDNALVQNSMAIIDSQVGVDEYPQEFKLTLAGNTTDFNIGGAVGNATNGTIISKVKVGNYAYEKNPNATINVNMNSVKKDIYLAGVVGSATNTILTGIDARTNIVLTGSNDDNKGDQTVTPFTSVAGLVANSTVSGTSNINITQSNVYCNIDMTRAGYIDNLMTAFGVALSHGYLDIAQCLFTGNINTEGTATINNIWASYVLGLCLSATAQDNIVIDQNEVMATGNINIGSNATNKIYSGGLVGQVVNALNTVNDSTDETQNSTNITLNIKNSSVDGKIIPISAIYNEDITKIYVGGLIGQAPNVNIMYVYDMVSIIADGLGADTIQNLHVNALFGSVGAVQISEDSLYYSSDYALFPEDSGYGKNISAYTMAFSNDWSKFTNTSIWSAKEGASDRKYAPYPRSLELALENYAIFRNDTTGAFTYPVGSARNPAIINETSTYNLSDKVYDFYLLSGSSSLDFIGSLSGVMIANEKIYKSNETNIAYNVAIDNEGKETNEKAIVPMINRHGAVSNLHVELSDSISHNGGIISAYNNGVIFNCSVQGTGLTVSGEIGLLSHTNTGLVSYSYSGAEFTTCNNDISGIVLNNYNGGKILTCYFTGYINNDNTAMATGIVKTSEDNSYVYNTYMAGIIEVISERYTSFSGNTLIGSNNFIDSFANIEEIENNNAIKTISTYDLMNTHKEEHTSITIPKLKGNWHTIIGSRSSTIVGITATYHDFIDLNATSFGYNYGYPVYNFHKDNEMNYQLYTGRGQSSDSVTDYIKISNLGVLSMIHGMANTWRLGDNSEIVLDNTYLNYAIIYDIDGKGIDWTDYTVGQGVIGTDAASTRQYLYSGSDAEFNGKVISNKNYAINDINDENACTIENISGSGLFGNINRATFECIKFGTMDIKDGGILGKLVKSIVDENDQKEATVKVNTINLSEAKVQAIENSKYVGGLFGEIKSGDVEINNLITKVNATSRADDATVNKNSRATITKIKDTEVSGLVTGLIAGKLSGGKIDIDSSHVGDKALTIAFEYLDIGDKADAFTYAGGIVGEMSAGSINGNNAEVKILTGYEANHGVDILAGVVGRVAENSSSSDKNTITISNVKVLVPVTNNSVVAEYKLKAQSFGGIVGEIKSGNASIEGCSFGIDSIVTGVNSNIVVYMNAGYNYLGLAVAKQIGGALCLNNFSAENINIKATVSNANADSSKADASASTSDESKQGFGTYLGLMTAGSFIEKNSTIKINNFTVDNGYNLGGLVGRYNAGTNVPNITLHTDLGTSGSDTIILNGTHNVGGAFGYFNGNIDTMMQKYSVDASINEGTSGEQIDKLWNFLQSKEGYATIGNNGITSKSLSNWGGLFGKFVGELTYKKNTGTDNTTTTRENDQPVAVPVITNRNRFIIYDAQLTDNPNLIGLGGVVGCLEGSAKNLSNEAGDKFITYYKNSGLGFNSDKYILNSMTNKSTLYTINVGGVIGLIDNTKEANYSITNIRNSSPVTGYQNVGGLIGYAKKISLINESLYEKASFNNNETPSDNELYFTRTENIVGDKKTYDYIRVESPSDLDNLYKVRKLDSLDNPLFTSSAEVSGVINVGGAIGYVGDSIIDSILSSSNIYGNTSVGGLIGRLRNSSVYNSLVGHIAYSNDANETKANATTEIKGIFYGLNIKTNNNFNDTQTIVYLPTSVGGFIGTADSSETNYVLKNNNIVSINVTSSNEGATIASGANKQTSSVISTIGNLMANIAIGEGSENIKPDKVDDYKELLGTDPDGEKATKFNSLSSGFGGFIGTTNENMIRNGDAITSNSIHVNVSAQLGINVGTFYGYLKGNDTNTTLNTPKLIADSSTSGAYNIGGVVGYLNGAISNYKIKDGATSFGKAITLQENGNGMYVGGLFGKVAKTTGMVNLNGIELHKEIIISNNAVSYYMGGLIGRLEGNMTGANVYDGVFDSNKPENFGGLVGLLKVVSGQTNDSGAPGATVKGIHKFAFTINTIENSNYYDAESIFHEEVTDEGKVYLYAQAYYINQDNFNISPSSNTKFNNTITTNPLNKYAQGWHKKYTGFRIVQRCIPQANTWDSVATIYDAANITHVGTIENLGLQGKGIQRKKYTSKNTANGLEESSDFVDCENDYICFTIYEEEPGSPKLYSPIGIATPRYHQVTKDDYKKDSEGNDILKEETPLYETLTDSKANVGEWLWGAFINESPLEDYYIDANHSNNGKNLNGLTYFEWGSKGEWTKYATLSNGNNHRTFVNNQDGKKNNSTYISYFVKGYLAGDESNEGDAKYSSSKGAYFVFQTVFENESANGLTYDNGKTGNDKVSGSLGGITDHELPQSGLLFEVTGYISKNAQITRENAGAIDWFAVGTFVGALVIDITIAVATAGTGTAATSLMKEGAKQLAKGVAKETGKAMAKQGAKKLLAKAAKATGKFIAKNANKFIALFTCIALYSATKIYSAGTSESQYFKEPDRNFGYLSSVYSREIYYNKNSTNDKVYNIAQLDDSFTTDDGQEMTFYSYNRPADYVTHRYLGVKVELTEEGLKKIAFTENKTSTVVTLEEEDIDLDLGASTYPKSLNDITGYASVKWISDGDEVNVTLCQFTGLDGIFILYDNYLYKDGMYWINNLSGSVSYQRTTAFFEPPEDEDGDAYKGIKYYFSDIDSDGNNNIYVYGSFFNGEYNVDGFPGNLVKKSGEKYTINNATLDAKKVENVQLRTFTYSNTINNDNKENFMEGYEYMYGAYYTANGIKFEDGNLKNYATYRRLDSKPEDFDKYRGSNYLRLKEEIKQVIDDKTVITYEDVYFEIEKIGEEVITGWSYADYTEDMIFNKNSSFVGYTDKEKIKIIIYPTSFINPYKSEIPNSQDNNYYIYSSESGVPHNVTYYLFEGGYYVDRLIDENDKDNYIDEVFIRVNKNDYVRLTDENGAAITNAPGIEDVTIDENTTIKAFKYTSIAEHYVDLKGYYLSGAKLETDYRTENGKENGTILYKLNTSYVVGGENSGTEKSDGLLYYMTMSYGSNQTAQIKSYNYNKYLINSTFDLYSRYKYIFNGNPTNLDFTDVDGVWDSNSLLPESGKTSINNGKPTYFVERVQVTLSGGNILKHLAGSTGTAGSIKPGIIKID